MNRTANFKTPLEDSFINNTLNEVNKGDVREISITAGKSVLQEKGRCRNVEWMMMDKNRYAEVTHCKSKHHPCIGLF